MKKNSPDILFITYLDIIQKSGSDSPMKKLTPDLLLNQEIFLYSSASKRYGELIIDILFYKKILSKKNISFDKLGSYIKKIRSNPKDKLDKILLESFDLMVKYTDQQLHLESNRYWYLILVVNIYCMIINQPQLTTENYNLVD